MEEMSEDRSTRGLLGKIAVIIWPQTADDGTSVWHGEISMKLLELSGSAREARRYSSEVIALERAARFVDIASEKGEATAGRYAARQAYALVKSILNPRMTWEQALADLREGHAVRRDAWFGLYLDAEFGADNTFPYTGHDGTPFQVVAVQPNGTTKLYEELSEEDAKATDWHRA